MHLVAFPSAALLMTEFRTRCCIWLSLTWMYCGFSWWLRLRCCWWNIPPGGSPQVEGGKMVLPIPQRQGWLSLYFGLLLSISGVMETVAGPGGEGIKLLPQIHKSLWAKLFLASPFYNPCLRALCHQKLDICPNCRAENLVPVLSVGLPQSPWPHFCSATCRPQLTQRREIQWSRLKLNGKELGPCYYLSRSPSRISIFIQPCIPVNLFLPPQSNKSDWKINFGVRDLCSDLPLTRAILCMLQNQYFRVSIHCL